MVSRVLLRAESNLAIGQDVSGFGASSWMLDCFYTYEIKLGFKLKRVLLRQEPTHKNKNAATTMKNMQCYRGSGLLAA